jgi:hypothetical protein
MLAIEQVAASALKQLVSLRDDANFTAPAETARRMHWFPPTNHRAGAQANGCISLRASRSSTAASCYLGVPDGVSKPRRENSFPGVPRASMRF